MHPKKLNMVSLDDDHDCTRGHRLYHVLLCHHLAQAAEEDLRELRYFSSVEVESTGDRSHLVVVVVGVLDWEALDCTRTAVVEEVQGHSLGLDRTDHIVVGEVDMAVDHSLHCCTRSTHLEEADKHPLEKAPAWRNSDYKQPAAADRCYKQGKVLVADNWDLDREEGRLHTVAVEDTDLLHYYCYNLVAAVAVLANTDHRAAARTDRRRAVVNTVGNLFHQYIHRAVVAHNQKYTRHTCFVVRVVLVFHRVVATTLATFHQVEYDYNDDWQTFPLLNPLVNHSCTKIHSPWIYLPCRQSLQS